MTSPASWPRVAKYRIISLNFRLLKSNRAQSSTAAILPRIAVWHNSRFVIRDSRIEQYILLMTLPQLAHIVPTQSLRALSQTVFGRPHQLEIAAAVAGIQEGFEVDALHRQAQDAATSADLDPPSLGATRKNLARLIAVGA